MNEVFAAIPSVLPDIVAAVLLILLGIAFIRGRIRYREEERRLQDTIASLQEAEEKEKDCV